MPHINCYIDPRTMAILERESMVRGMSIEQLASKAIESFAISTLLGGRHNSSGFDGDHCQSDAEAYFSRQPGRVHDISVGKGITVNFRENDDGSLTPF